MTGMPMPEGTVARGEWGRAADFFVTMLGFAVGLGNIWRFPAQVYRYGGGAFLIPYIIAIVLIGIPLFLIESSIGQYCKRNSVQLWDLSPVFRGVGLAGTSVITLINIYYTSPCSWALWYLGASMTDQMPWRECDPAWATNSCINATASEEYFYREVIKVSSGLEDWGTLNWQLMLCNLGIWLLIFAGMSFGAASLGKVAYFTSLFPYVMLTILLVMACLLDGSGDGIYFYVYPRMELLGDIRVWSVAISQVFFSTGIGTGVVAQMSSYNKFDHNVLRDSILVPMSDCLTSFYAGFAVFAILGYMANLAGTSVDNVVESGPGLIFITYPQAFLSMDGGNVWSVFFFFMCCILGLSSAIPSVEAVASLISDYLPWFNVNRGRNIFLRGMVCLIQFGLGMFFYMGNGFYVYSLVDDRVIGYGLLIVGFFEVIAIAWFFGPFRLLEMIEEMIGGWKTARFFRYFFIVSWCFICPIAIMFIFISDVTGISDFVVLEYTFPDWATAIGWALVSISGTLITVWFLAYLCYACGLAQFLYKQTQPSSGWKRRDDAFPDEPVELPGDKGALEPAKPAPYYQPTPSVTAGNPAPSYYQQGLSVTGNPGGRNVSVGGSSIGGYQQGGFQQQQQVYQTRPSEVAKF